MDNDDKFYIRILIVLGTVCILFNVVTFALLSQNVEIVKRIKQKLEKIKPRPCPKLSCTLTWDKETQQYIKKEYQK